MRKQMFVSVLALSMSMAFQVLANPTGPAVAAGSASFSTSGNTLTVVNTNNTIINWQGFSIGAGETTRFNQSSSSSIVLNRVVTANPSSIFGSLTSNGNVFLVNPSGVLFGQGSQVSVGGLTVLTADITDSNFLAGVYTFSVGGTGNIVLGGTISSTGNLTFNSPGTTSGGGIITSSGNVNVPGQVVTGGGVSVISGSSITVAGSTSTGTILLTNSKLTTDSRPGAKIAAGSAAPLGVGTGRLVATTTGNSGSAATAGVTLNLEKRDVGF